MGKRKKVSEEKNVKKEYHLILKYRSHIMAVMICWIVFFHSGLSINNPILKFIKDCGYGGVDIFLFLSGIGLYYSVSKHSMEVFYKRRLERLLPSYLPFIIGWFAMRTFIAVKVSYVPIDTSLRGILSFLITFFGNLTMTGWFLGLESQFNWYVQMLALFYLATPALYAFVKYAGRRKINCTLFFCALFCFSGCFFYRELLMGMSRIPVFAMGMLTAYLMEEKNGIQIKKWVWYLLMAAGAWILHMAWTDWGQYAYGYGLYWYPFLLVTPGLCILLAEGFEAVGTGKIREKLLAVVKRIGDASFEIYLIHIALFSFFFNIQGLDAHMLWFIWMPAAILIGMIYKSFVDFVRCKIKIRK